MTIIAIMIIITKFTDLSDASQKSCWGPVQQIVHGVLGNDSVNKNEKAEITRSVFKSYLDNMSLATGRSSDAAYSHNVHVFWKSWRVNFLSAIGYDSNRRV
jgi:hypothetical protein